MKTTTMFLMLQAAVFGVVLCFGNYKLDEVWGYVAILLNALFVVAYGRSKAKEK